MRISGTTDVYLVLGHPVAQVLAPRLYNHLFEAHGVDAVLVPAQVAPADLETFATSVLRAGNFRGLWLTIPHKTPLVPLLDRCDRAGRIARSVNAVRRNADGTLEGGLFDGSGFVRALRVQGFEPRGRRTLVVGAGGAGIAIAVALAEAGAAQVGLFDVAGDRAAQAAARLAPHFGGCEIAGAASSDPAGFDLVVNSTPLGLTPDDPLPFDAARLDDGATVVDILMKPKATPLLRACAERGIAAHSGHEMLVQQVPDYLRFFGWDAIADEVERDASEVRRLLQPGAAG